jgi:glycosyltransferase involved in cell wall biosynthesis
VLSYNRPEFLSRSVLSMIQNADEPFELIVHDDGSKDAVDMRVVLDWLQYVVGATVIRNAPGHNQGQGVALNRMFGMATGDPIYKLDHDLTYKPGWLSRSKRLILGNPKIGLLGLFHYYYEPCDSRRTLIEDHEEWSSRTHILGSAFGVRRHCWDWLGPFDEHRADFGEDWWFQKRVTASRDYCCALPRRDLVENFGFGIGPSTVNVAANTLQEIYTQPYLIVPPGVP